MPTPGGAGHFRGRRRARATRLPGSSEGKSGEEPSRPLNGPTEVWGTEGADVPRSGGQKYRGLRDRSTEVWGTLYRGLRDKSRRKSLPSREIFGGAGGTGGLPTSADG